MMEKLNQMQGLIGLVGVVVALIGFLVTNKNVTKINQKIGDNSRHNKQSGGDMSNISFFGKSSEDENEEK